MKRLLIVFCVISAISITQYVNAKECIISKQNANVEFLEQNNWEYIGTIRCRYGDEVNAYENGELYVKVISGKSFYKVKLRGEEYSVIKNPQYNPNGSQWYQKYTHMAGGNWMYYFNL